MKVDTEAGYLIKTFANQKDKELTDLASKLGVTYPHFINMLKGTKNINNKQFQKLCQLLELNKDQRFQLKEAIFLSNSEIVIPTKNKKKYLLRFYYLLSYKAQYISEDTIAKCSELINSNNKKDSKQKDRQ